MLADQDRARCMAAVLGHELRNPLAAAMTGVALAAEITDEGDPRRPVLDLALADLTRVADLLSAYLAFGGGRIADNEIVDLGALLRTVAGRRRPVVVDLNLSVPAANVRGNANLLARVVENLIENAATAGAQKVSLMLLAGPSEDGVEMLELEVTDDGPGVPFELQGQLFEFGVSGGSGSGIGLSLARAVLSGIGGSIQCAPVSEGARFVISLPALSDRKVRATNESMVRSTR